MNRFGAEIIQLQKEGLSPESEKGKNVAKVVMDTMLEITDGDLKIMDKFAESIETISALKSEPSEDFLASYRFIQAAMDAYINSEHGSFDTIQHKQ
jgi:uncharacterized glyoxalase superfamily protein PhnB